MASFHIVPSNERGTGWESYGLAFEGLRLNMAEGNVFVVAKSRFLGDERTHLLHT